jgi:Holliday junction resolvasome RuvABC endonuclease subunit
MARLTKTQARQMVEELLALRPAFERYQELEQAVKQAMKRLKTASIEVEDKGRVFVSLSERMTLDPTIARQVLGGELAQKIIKITETVSNPLLKALAEMGDISEEQMDDLRIRAEKTQVVSLHVRPLK